jgi:hypothetical protein
MKKLFTILLLLVAFISNAQNTLDNIGLTSATPASVAYSLRQLSTTYTGPLVRVKVGASFYDVYPDASTKNFSLSSKISASVSTYNAATAGASANALSTIISGSTDATVAIWYDQSGNGVHVLSSSATAKIITAGSILSMNGQPTINFHNSTSYFTSSTAVNYVSQSWATVNAVAQNVASTDGISGIINVGGLGDGAGFNWGLNFDPGTWLSGYWVDGSGITGALSGVNSTDPKVVTALIQQDAFSSIYVNSTLKGTKSTNDHRFDPSDVVFVGARGTYTGRYFKGNISETMIFPKSLSSTEQAALESSQSQFLPQPVTITSSASGTICAGTNVTFTATVSGISSPTYQWYKNSVAISGANSSTYTSTSLSNNDVIKVSAGDAIVTSGLIQHLDANNASSYTSGNTWTDLTGNGKNGTIVTGSSGSVAIATEGSIKSFNFTKGLSYISAPVTKSASMSFNVWAKTSSLTNYNSPGTMLFNAGASGTGPTSGGPDLFISQNKISWNTYDAMSNSFKLNGTDITPTSASINDANWHFFSVVVDAVSNTTSLYIDGVFKGAAVYKDPNLFNTTALFIGGEGNNANITNYDLAWVGNISAFQSYSRALSSAEVVQNFNSKATFFGVNSAALTVSNSITVAVSGAAPTITVTGDGCAKKTTLTTPSGATAYAWYKDNVVISGATSNVYTPTAAGVYKVEVTNGSCSSTSTSATIYECGRTADGRMIAIEGSTTMVSRDGSIDNGKGVNENGKIVAKPWVYGTVTTATGRIWLDRNLGASRVATSSTDALAYGDYFQWGRPADGHQTKYLTNNNSSGFTNTKSSSSVPSTDLWIVPTDASNDWLATPDNSLWAGANPATNPCPVGFRIPTESEWEAERITWVSNNAAGAFASSLKLTRPGMLTGFGSGGATYTAKDNFGQYLTQSANTNGGARYFGIEGGNAWFDQNYYKWHGMSVRCIKN